MKGGPYPAAARCITGTTCRHPASKNARGRLSLGRGSSRRLLIELTPGLRDDERTKHVAIIVLTGRSFGADPRQVNEVGCNKFLLKPCLPGHLAVEIRHALGARRSAVERDTCG